MYNRVQQRFDKSIRDVIEHTKSVNDAKPRRRIVVPPREPETKTKGRLYLCPETGATIWDPAA